MLYIKLSLVQAKTTIGETAKIEGQKNIDCYEKRKTQ